MIRSFRDPEAKKLFEDEFSRKLQAIERPARRRLAALDAAESVEDLRAIPGHRLEMLKGDRQGQYSVRVNDQYRICFVWTDSGPDHVEIVDYH